MSPFDAYPKQWLIARTVPSGCVAEAELDGWKIMRAPGVPLIRLLDANGTPCGFLIGWVIRGGDWILDGGSLSLESGERPDDALEHACGRFVWLWKEGAHLRIGLDAGGLLPAVWSTELGAIASTPTVLGLLGPVRSDAALEAVFAFPKRRGFFPFGLTSWQGISRLLPNHELDLETMESVRTWPPRPIVKLAADDAAGFERALDEIVSLVQPVVEAIVRRGRGRAILYLSAGHDSRMTLAACRDVRDEMICETIGSHRSFEVMLARRVAEAAGVRHQNLEIVPPTDADIDAWLHRTGRCIYDPVTRLVATVVRHDRGYHAITGSCAEILRASNWSKEDPAQDVIDLATLLKRIRMPGQGGIAEAGAAWMGELPELKRTDLLDIAKIEMIYGCWAGPSVYGHPIDHPSMHPFNIRRIYALSLTLPDTAKLSGKVYRAFVQRLWPELLKVPVNRATGLDRLRYPKEELQRMMPKKLKQLIKPFR